MRQAVGAPQDHAGSNHAHDQALLQDITALPQLDETALPQSPQTFPVTPDRTPEGGDGRSDTSPESKRCVYYSSWFILL